ALSAMFIPNSHEFMWQDEKDIIYTQNVEGKIITQFQHPFTVQNHRITADKTFYLSADYNNDLYLGYGENMKTIYNDGASISKPVDLSIVGDFFLSVTAPCSFSDKPAETNLTEPPINPSSRKKSSYDGVTLWDKNTLKPIAKLYGNCGKSSGLISPDGKWVIAGGENLRNYMWSIEDLNQRLSLERVDNSVIYREPLEPNKKHPIPIPPKYDGKKISRSDTITFAFLTPKDFIVLQESSHHDGKGNELARLLTVGERWIKGYVEIGNNPSISTNYFQRNLSVSSSPSAHILVTGQAT
ncbi:WD40 repeat domain-containing protein, partial [Avibacterium volantium]|uniref:WD40 repeat domain-containing protein n=1 Tax=Avibacterium volantium TaxID=762 RepID=UPI003BF89FAF